MITTWVNSGCTNLAGFLLKAGQHEQIPKVGTETFLLDREGLIVYVWVLAKLPLAIAKPGVYKDEHTQHVGQGEGSKVC